MCATDEFGRVTIQSIHDALLLVQLLDNRMRRVADLVRVDHHLIVWIANVAQEVLNRLALLPTPTSAVLRKDKKLSLRLIKALFSPSTPDARERHRAR